MGSQLDDLQKGKLSHLQGSNPSLSVTQFVGQLLHQLSYIIYIFTVIYYDAR